MVCEYMPVSTYMVCGEYMSVSTYNKMTTVNTDILRFNGIYVLGTLKKKKLPYASAQMNRVFVCLFRFVFLLN